MEYKYEERNKGLILAGTLFDEGDLEKQPSLEELREVYAKAKAFDEIKIFVISKLKEKERETYTTLNDYDYKLYQAYENIDDIIQEYMEDK